MCGEGEEKLWLAGLATGAIALLPFGLGLGRVVCCMWLWEGTVHQSPCVSNGLLSNHSARCLSHLSMWHRKPLRPHCWRPLKTAHAAAWSICILVPCPHLQHPAYPALWQLERWQRAGILALPNGRSACLPTLGDGAGWWERCSPRGDKAPVLPNRSHKGCHHKEHIHCRAAAAAARHLQKLISKDK